jgi:hypothetical protein
MQSWLGLQLLSPLPLITKPEKEQKHYCTVLVLNKTNKQKYTTTTTPPYTHTHKEKRKDQLTLVRNHLSITCTELKNVTLSGINRSKALADKYTMDLSKFTCIAMVRTGEKLLPVMNDSSRQVHK